MHYSQILFALPVAHAAIMARDPDTVSYVTEVDTAQAVAYTTTMVTVTVGAGPSAAAYGNSNGQPWNYGGQQPKEAAPAGNQNQNQNWGDNWGVYNHQGYHSHHHHASHANPNPQPITTVAPPVPVVPTTTAQPLPVTHETQPSQPKPSTSSGGSGGSGGSAGGCPADTSGQYMSDGVNGQPSRSMLDSINEIRRLYNSNAACLAWSPSLGEASDACANIAKESALRANSGVVSDPYYDNGSTPNKLSTTLFENSMYSLLCQSPGDPQLQGSCGQKMGEDGCKPMFDNDPTHQGTHQPDNPNCTGHHDMVVDTKNENRFMGVGANSALHWLSASFSKTNNIFD